MLRKTKDQSLNYVITLDSFKPIMSNEGDKWKLTTTHMKVDEMFKGCFHDDNIDDKIDVAMKKNMKDGSKQKKLPTLKQNTGLSKEQSSIFDNNQRQVHCLSTVNYF